MLRRGVFKCGRGLHRGSSRARTCTESDVAPDNHQATSRVTGGVFRQHTADPHSTTGPGVSAVFVGRVAGEDPGYHGETGAERRAR